MFWIQLAVVKQYFIAEVISFETRVNIINVTNKGLLHPFDLPKAVFLEFSPKSTFLATWQPYTTSKDGTAGIPNLQLYDVKTGTCLKSFIQKKMQNW